MSAGHPRPSSLRGLAFGIEDLLLLRDWAEAQSLRMRVHLDHGIEGEEYEEVLAFSKPGSSLSQFIMWRDASAIYLHPLIGRPRRYGSVALALAIICPAPDVKITDIRADSWPR
ncbi:MAG TPA: hypothetical protein VFG62_23395 [Rhodopila sp.]|nr:hypothetical protein [Rhodopila sp.]